MLIDSIKKLAKLDKPIDSDEFNKALADIQKQIGVDDGGYAGEIFSAVDDEWENTASEFRLIFLVDYVKKELDHSVDIGS
jgi:hypothetical protein